MVDDRVRALEEAEPDEAKLEPWIQPRASTGSWDSTDEMYISYDQEGNRVLVTFGRLQRQEVWNAGQAASSTKDSRQEFAGARPRPGWAGGDTGAYPAVDADRTRHLTGVEPGRGEAVGDWQGGGSFATAANHPRHRIERGGLAERPATGDNDPTSVRSHRHCPGCNGHETVAYSGWWSILRGIGAWALGFIAAYFGLGLDLGQYLGLTSFVGLAIIVGRPAWRDFVILWDVNVTTNGGRR